jgi:hypothetical protein
MDVIKGLRLLAAFLMMLNGADHLVETPFAAGMWMAVMALFGLLYSGIGIGLFVGNPIFYYLGAIIPLVGACIATLHDYSYVVKPAQFVRRNPMVGIDIIVILCCCYILEKTPS